MIRKLLKDQNEQIAFSRLNGGSAHIDGYLPNNEHIIVHIIVEPVPDLDHFFQSINSLLERELKMKYKYTPDADPDKTLQRDIQEELSNQWGPRDQSN